MKRKRAQVIEQSNVINIDSRKRVQLYPKNLSQENYLLKLNDENTMIVFAIGPAGTGKTMLGVQWAVDEFKYGNADRIVVTRPAVSVDEQHGFLPGDLNQKMEPWTKPIFDVFRDNYSAKAIENFVKEGVIEISPLAYMRGRSFLNSVIIADEMQLATPNQMKMLLTRIGEGSKMIVTGDLEQADRGSNNGLKEFLTLLKNKNPAMISMVEFGDKDIVRHPVVKEVLEIYNS